MTIENAVSNPQLILYSLLYINADNSESHANIPDSVPRPIDVYLQCARLLARSCAASGYVFKLVTNRYAYAGRRLEDMGGGVDLVDMSFAIDVPKGIPFYSAHFKLELIHEIGKGHCGDFVALIDLDTVLLKPFSLPPQSGNPPGLYVYDITRQELPTGCLGELERSFSLLGFNSISHPFWIGGEFIAGHYSVFEELARIVLDVWPTYIATFPQLRHVGDEMLVSLAANLMRMEGVQVSDLGNGLDDHGISQVCRWWSVRTRHKQMRLSDALKVSLLHLPADKVFLARQADLYESTESFVKSYKSYVCPRVFVRQMANFLDWRSGDTGFAPRL